MSGHITASATAPDRAKVGELLDRVLADLGAVLAGANAIAGDRLGLYRGLAEGGPQTARELAERAGAGERAVRAWLCGQAAGGYVTYDPQAQTFSLTPEQEACLADPSSPTFVAGAFRVAARLYRDDGAAGDALGAAHLLRAGCVGNLTARWIPALGGVEARLRGGARVADVGCGDGASTLLLAETYPACEIAGFDDRESSIEAARAAAARAGAGDRVRFEVAAASSYPGEGYDLVVTLDGLRDVGDPVGAARHVRRTLGDDGAWLLVEPCAGDRVEDTLTPAGRVYYGAAPLSRCEIGPALGERRLGEIVRAGGFTRVRRVAETSFNLVLEARPTIDRDR